MKRVCPALLIFVVLVSCSRRDDRRAVWLSLTDDLGRTISLDHPPQRIVSLAPSLTEMCFALDGGITLVGVTDYCDYPPQAKNKTSVGGMVLPNVERIADLKPDLILATVEGNSKEDVSKLESLGYRAFVSNPRTINDIYTSLLTLGKMLRRDSTAARLVRELRTNEEHVRANVGGERRPKVFAVISLKPLMSAGSSTFIHQLIVEAGGTNIAEKAPTPYPLFNREQIVHDQPEIILLTSDAAASTQDLLREFPEWRGLAAVRKGQVLVIDSDIVTRPGPRIIQGLEILARVFHPEKFRKLPPRLQEASVCDPPHLRLDVSWGAEPPSILSKQGPVWERQVG